jgi:NTP pyrophosphatase (non-canonical NTP hydrolase)
MSETQKIKTTAPKTLAQMTAEIVENNTAKGWYEKCATFPEAMAMLHSEVSEALEAWRSYGLQDATKTPWSFIDQPGEVHPPKPEGVGSEFADILIRLLDDAWLFGKIDLEKAAGPGRFGVSDSFPDNMNTLHMLISRASVAQEFEWDAGDIAREFGGILVFLRQLSEKYGIDLPAEYERKMAWNRTRPYRHGGKRI